MLPKQTENVKDPTIADTKINAKNSGKTKKVLGKKASDRLVFWLFLAPALIPFVLMVILPFILGIYYSFTDWTGLNTGNEIWIGLDNYRGLFTDYRFIYSFIRTFQYSFLNILLINIVAFALALLVTQKLVGKNVYRAGFFMPNLIGGLVLGFIWQFIYNRVLSAIGQTQIVLYLARILDRDPFFQTSALTSGNTALIALVVVVTWQYAGYIMMIYIAAIQNIPQDLVEASKIDGANAFQRLKTITLPLVAQAFTVAMFLTLVTSFKQFDTVMSLTRGGPAQDLPLYVRNLLNLTTEPTVQSTSLIAVNIYQEAFTRYNMAIGQAKAIVFFIVLLVIALIQVYYNKRKEVEL
ncbi:carbohydrate ABC transporter permease [Liberiplasma polymorphum]|uniref:carbohydrate ABC transporter permease n=1 Tax=Liberiplasma polymorphum TaxID=3374570 RepID=UPI003774A3A5